MSLDAFQRAVVDLTLDYRKSRALRDGDDRALAGYDLTDRERSRLAAIVQQPAMSVHCSLSRGNRLEVIAGVFPMTCVLLDAALEGLLDELWQEHKPFNYQLRGEETAFAALVDRKLRTGECNQAYLAEVFAYEMICWDLTQRVRTAPEVAAEATLNFEHCPSDLLPPLSQLMAPPSNLPKGSYPAVVRLRNDAFEVDLLPAC